LTQIYAENIHTTADLLKIEKGYPRFLDFEPVGPADKTNRRKEHSPKRNCIYSGQNPLAANGLKNEPST
jgi:hypothetical protein